MLVVVINLKSVEKQNSKYPKWYLKKIVLLFLSSVLEPLGLFAPFTMRMKMFLKSIWIENGRKGDEEINDTDQALFLTWASELKFVNENKICRECFEPGGNQYSVHVFLDNSGDAMCIVEYLVKVNNIGIPELSFVIGKGRIAPMRQLPIRKLKPQAALYSAIIQEHDIPIVKFYNWKDSVTMLQ